MAGFERHFDLIAYQLEVVAHVLLAPHALFWANTMVLPSMEFLAMGASVLLVFFVLVLLLFPITLAQLGMLGLFAIRSTEVLHLL